MKIKKNVLIDLQKMEAAQEEEEAKFVMEKQAAEVEDIHKKEEKSSIADSEWTLETTGKQKAKMGTKTAERKEEAVVVVVVMSNMDVAVLAIGISADLAIGGNGVYFFIKI
jgi:hypothetical protein